MKILFYVFLIWFVSDSAVEFSGPVAALVKELTEKLFATTKSAVELNNVFKEKYINSLPHRIAGKF